MPRIVVQLNKDVQFIYDFIKAHFSETLFKNVIHTNKLIHKIILKISDRFAKKFFNDFILNKKLNYSIIVLKKFVI